MFIFLKPSVVLNKLLVVSPVPPVIRTIHLHEIMHPTSLFEFYSMQMWQNCVRGYVRLRLVYLIRCTDTCRSPISPTQSHQLQADPLICDQESAYQVALTCEDLIKHVALSFTDWAQPFCATVTAAANEHDKSGNCVSHWQQSKLQPVCWFTIRKQCLFACPCGNLFYGDGVASDSTEVQCVPGWNDKYLTRCWQRCLWWPW